MTITDVRGRAHRPAGSPASTGGQFADQPTPRQAMRLSREDTAGLLRVNQEVKRMVQSKFGAFVDPEEIVATMNEIAVKKLASGDWDQLSGNWGYLRNAAHSQAITQANQGMRGEERTAMVRLKQRMEQIAQQRGSEVRTGEIESLADEVRMSFPPGRRPRIGWHLSVIHRDDSLDRAVSEDGDASMGDFIEHSEQEEQTLYDDALRQMQAGYGRSSMSAEEVSLKVWGIIRAEDESVPPVQKLSKRDAAAAAGQPSGMGVTRARR